MVVLDMAGTSIEENNLVYYTLRETMEKNGYLIGIDTVLSHAAGKEKKEALADLYKVVKGTPITIEEKENLYQEFLQQLDQAYDHHPVKPARGLVEILNFLRQQKIRVVLNTGYNTYIARKLLNRVGIDEFRDIDLLVTADMVSKQRPHPDMINYALEYFKINAVSCIKVGDSTVDIQEGFNAGCRYSIGITTGAQNFFELTAVEPSFIIDDLEELIPIIQKINEAQ